MTEALAAARPATGRKDPALAAVRRLVTGVTVLTCGDRFTVEGVTVSTVALASVRPPMISVALREDSRGLHALLSRDGFVANGLAAGQDVLAEHFASKQRSRGLQQLPAGTWSGLSSHGVPRLRGALAPAR